MQPELDPDVPWVAALSHRSEAVARRAVREAEGERRLFGHLRREHASGGRPSYVEIDAPLELYALVRLLRPTHVVEVGVSSGVSSAYLLEALARNGKGTLHSIDRPKLDRPSAKRLRPHTSSWALPPGRFSGWAVPFPLRARWDLRIGDKKDVLPLLTEELDQIDLFVYDVPHDDDRSRGEFGEIDRRLAATGVAIADHGPGGGLCDALLWWARRRHATPIGRTGLGLYGFRAVPA